MINTPNMNLMLPTPGVDPGPDYAQENNTAFSTIDSHDHSPGKGVPVTPSGISITTDLSFLGNNAINLRSARFTPSTIPALAPDLAALFVNGVDLYYNDGNGNQVRITQSGSVTGATGTITGLPSGTAGAAYSSIAQKFIFSSATGVPAKIDAGDLILRNLSTPTNAITLSAPSSLPASYSLTLPSVLPAVQSFATIDNAGTVATGRPYAVGQQISSSSGTFNTTSSSFVNVTNLSISITTTGRPVILLFIDGEQNANGAVVLVSGVAGQAQIKLLRASTTLAIWQLGSADTASTLPSYYTPGSFIFFDVPSAGTYTYTVQTKVQFGNGIEFDGIKLVAYEL